MVIFGKIFGRGDEQLANLPKDERLKVFHNMKSFAHYIGFAGEKLVMAELLLRGINVSKPTVDDGVDLIAMKDGKNYSIQVKTAFRNEGKDRWMFNLSLRAQTDANSTQTKADKIGNFVYVFVLIEDVGEPYNYLIMPFSEMKKQAKKNNIYYHKSTKRYRINVYLRDGKLSLGDLKNDVSEFLNKWELLGAERKTLKQRDIKTRKKGNMRE